PLPLLELLILLDHPEWHRVQAAHHAILVDARHAGGLDVLGAGRRIGLRQNQDAFASNQRHCLSPPSCNPMPLASFQTSTGDVFQTSCTKVISSPWRSSMALAFHAGNAFSFSL